MAFNMFRRNKSVVEDLPARPATPDTGRSYPDDSFFDDYQYTQDGPYDDEPQLSVAVIDGGVPVGPFEYNSINDFADAVRNFGDYYGADGTVTLVITAL